MDKSIKSKIKSRGIVVNRLLSWNSQFANEVMSVHPFDEFATKSTAACSAYLTTLMGWQYGYEAELRELVEERILELIYEQN